MYTDDGLIVTDLQRLWATGVCGIMRYELRFTILRETLWMTWKGAPIFPISVAIPIKDRNIKVFVKAEGYKVNPNWFMEYEQARDNGTHRERLHGSCRFQNFHQLFTDKVSLQQDGLQIPHLSRSKFHSRNRMSGVCEASMTWKLSLIAFDNVDARLRIAILVDQRLNLIIHTYCGILANSQKKRINKKCQDAMQVKARMSTLRCEERL